MKENRSDAHDPPMPDCTSGKLPAFEDILDSRNCLLYLYDVALTLQKLEQGLRQRGDSKEILMASLKAACEFYQADFCGALNVDMDVGIWNPVWWYRASVDGMKEDLLFYPLESADDFPEWKEALRNNTAVVIPDVEEIKDTSPHEYKMYQRLQVKSVIGVPYYKGSMGFLVVKNMRIHQQHTGMMHVMSYCVASMILDLRLIEEAQRFPKPESIQCEKDVYIRLFGRFQIITAQGSRDAVDLKSVQQPEIITYLLLNQRKRPHTSLEIYMKLWPDKYNSVIEDPDSDAAPEKNIKSQIYRFRQKTRGLFPDGLDLIEHTAGGYCLNHELRITSDVDLFDDLYHKIPTIHGELQKTTMLEQAMDLYSGHLLEESRDNEWISNYAVQYKIKYLDLVSDYCKLCDKYSNYTQIARYAGRAMWIENANPRVYYWLIRAYQKLGDRFIADSQLHNAKMNLTAEEFESLQKALESGNYEVLPEA